MADSFSDLPSDSTPATADVEISKAAAGTAAATADFPFPEGGAMEDGDAPAPRVSFSQHLATPIGLLVRSPFLREACEQFAEGGSPRQIELPDEDLDATGCFLEFLYMGDYFPRKVQGQRTLEKDPSIPDVDMTGDQLLQHAKVYTLADKFGLVHLKNLASSKIHCVNSTAKGEIAYARYVYQFTPKEDTSIRVPVANFWATRSHTLRSEAENEFRALCLEYPQFGYDVLTRVLDEKLKRERNEKMHPGAAPGSVRKRPRPSSSAAA
ncbi:hypothetical protein C8A05DRAFT_33376 [Staphylotrichum tortipilum]|uniref:BTB domain-containing protein n=1 Tax=Staphylotrichum tortipilum TaxID=2831512 RepID=A0AAN6RUF1_9PEZI|nr:hypothetical protein C8A05DRAFT_33376 [Staphylotrichum longicolle]